MDPQQAYEQRDTVQLLDVRETDEWVAGHIEGALHIPMDEVGSRQHELAKDRAIVTVCRSGSRAAAVADALNGAGYRAQTLDGGMEAWAASGLPFVSDSPRPARVA